MKDFEPKSFDSPQQLADFYSKKDATKGMILEKLKSQFGLTNEESEFHIARAKFKNGARTRGHGLQEWIAGSVIVVLVAIIASVVTGMLLAAGYFPGLPLWLIAGGTMLYGVIMAFRGLMKFLSGSATE